MRAFHSLSYFCYVFGVLRVHVRVLWDISLFRSWLICIMGMRDEWPFTRVSRSLSFPSFHHWWYDFPLLYWYGLIIIHSTSSLPIHAFLSPLFLYWFLLLFLSYIDTHFLFETFFTLFTCFIDSLTISHFSLSFYHWNFLWLLLGLWLMRFFHALRLIHEGMGLIIGYLSLISLRFFTLSP